MFRLQSRPTKIKTGRLDCMCLTVLACCPIGHKASDNFLHKFDDCEAEIYCGTKY